MLDCCLPIDVVKESGLPLGKLACLARCNGAQAVVHHASDFSVDDFRRSVKEITSATYDRDAAAEGNFK
jgi:glutathione gamma-glutamylcysteinyltransferase